MNEKLTQYKERTLSFWQSRTVKQKGIMVGSIVFILMLIALFAFFGSRTHYVPLYNNLTVQETGEIQAQLDSMNVSSQVSDGGTTINVPESRVDDLKVQLAAEGVPESGSIDYSSFEENMGFGTTDNEFNVLERAAMQTEIENLIRNIEGVENAQVMITLPEESVWVAEEGDVATASVLLNLRQGYSLDQEEVAALYHLVSKSVPNLPPEEVAIMDQNFRDYALDDRQSGSGINSPLEAYDQQRAIQRDIERDIQREVRQMLGTMMGPDKVLVTVSTDMDFTQENREEHLVEPVDEEEMEGIAISAERVTETYEGDDAPAEGGVPGTGEDDVPNFPAGAAGGGGNYEMQEERINNEVNRIYREISESPYKLRDIGIQVMVEPPDPEDPNSLPQERIDDIEEILNQIVRTSLPQDVVDDWGDADVGDRVFVSSQAFIGQPEMPEPETGIPGWYYVVGGLVALILLLLVLLFRRRPREDSEERTSFSEEEMPANIPDINDEEMTEEKARREQLERLAKEKPEEFTKLIRSWLSDD
ncbi:flagellar basal-body MS-ring/collar protein FliF [Texcoconibacillus texcoconensis]|uniref:Flagellar M-ring protein n=1 Tax=Texcoconibacillus texcoconensis TaxID=1095777 RepID=A0A840QL42_9BACI|nr:flagellar basal-body MS-ring/collar protein FliF [Texcoconibacillus texcoconensis]MBB5172080.1 flagellar M-ring protein FliF [Texcoconibacillus texcoconensis]